MQDLRLWFEKAGLTIKVSKEPLHFMSLAVNNIDIFQMSIETRGKKRKREYFKIYLGHYDNEIRVIDADSKKQQVILLVNEPEREYMTRQWDHKKRDWVYEIQKAPGYLRKYLAGFDEQHLFIAELPNDKGIINRVKDAHEILKPPLVTKKEKNTNRIKRQGEWFFIPITKKKYDLINENLNFIRKKKRISIRWRINPHIADEIIRIDEIAYVRGKIYHAEHHTLKLHGWFRVARNAEARLSGTLSAFITNGVKFVD